MPCSSPDKARLVDLSCLDDDAQGEPLSVVWEHELDARVLEDDIGLGKTIEAVLAHSVGGIEGAYTRTDLSEHRRRLMDSWAAYLTATDAKVVALPS